MIARTAADQDLVKPSDDAGGLSPICIIHCCNRGLIFVVSMLLRLEHRMEAQQNTMTVLVWLVRSDFPPWLGRRTTWVWALFACCALSTQVTADQLVTRNQPMPNEAARTVPPPPVNPIICKKISQSGTHMRRRVCKPTSAWQQARRSQRQELMSDLEASRPEPLAIAPGVVAPF